ncbi:MAG: glycosyl transferase [Pseudopedobacter saltans]|uniref:Glycosyl transferase n=1 Tax=Pseudopedobacter saltans TaxID=151895 RepID=A0A2W5EYL9_9SPHI|nr:MAG: glycosyl transferase [Pseudopedobacter saltans]
MVSIVSGIIFFLLLCYIVLLMQYKKWFSHLKEFHVNNTHPSGNLRFSIIIPARDEEENIDLCLRSILANDYPLNSYEILVIDDFSTDQTARIIQDISSRYLNVRLLKMEHLIPNAAQLNSYKKKAIELAIGKSTGDWIITTDADCTVGPKWLSSFEKYIDQTNNIFVAAPVKFTNNGSFISIFQGLDFLSLQGITAASVSAGFHSMCNGANLCYKKEAFLAVDGFKGVDQLASGDDMFLMHKIQTAFPDRIGYLFGREVIVSTKPMPDVKSFLNQRIRWASKADSYQDKRIIFVLVGVYLLNLSLLLGLLACFFYPPFILIWLISIFVKILFEIRFLLPVSRFYNSTKLLLYFPLMEIPHIIYTVLAGFLGKFGKYQWKGRTVK